MASSAERSWLATYWGIYQVSREGAGRGALLPWAEDPRPAEGFPTLDVFRNRACRIGTPKVRAGYLRDRENSDRTRRGAEPMVTVDWDTALDLVADAIRRVRDRYGNEAIYAGSYGWASPGRFHHAQSQMKRFMNLAGGFTGSVNTYSSAAAEVLIPHVFGDIKFKDIAPTWPDIEGNTQLVVSFGGLKLKNAKVDAGSAGPHVDFRRLSSASAGGMKLVVVDPVLGSEEHEVGSEWLPIIPNTDTALILALCYVLLDERLHDGEFLRRYCSGHEEFISYVKGESDGVPKTPQWAHDITGIDARRIASLARDMAGSRTLITIAWALQRADRGEHPFWAAIALSCLLGQLNKPGGGLAMGFGCFNNVSEGNPHFRFPTLPQGRNSVELTIPVARVVEMLERPGKTIDFNGRAVRFPDIQMIYWVGGNPFHHHQDLNRLRAALAKPDVIVAQDPWQTTFAAMADIALPVTTILERNDVATSRNGGYVTPMRQSEEPAGESRNDHAIFRSLAARLGFADAFDERLSERDWINRIYEEIRTAAAQNGDMLPSFPEFWDGGPVQIRTRRTPLDELGGFLGDPQENPLKTESGKIVLSSNTIRGFGYPEFGHHPNWMPPAEYRGSDIASEFPFHLLSDQPAKRLHSQLIGAQEDRGGQELGREEIWISEPDAKAKGISSGDVVRVRNARGMCLCTASVSPHIRQGVVKLSTGSRGLFFSGQDVLGRDMRGGNPNMVTRDKGCSRLSQGPSPQTCLVDLERVNEW